LAPRRLTQKQLDTLGEVYLYVAQISDLLGSEASSPAIVLPTHATTLAAAVAELMPKDYQVIRIKTESVASDFAPAADPRLEALRALIQLPTRAASAALCGGENFRPKASSRGGFFVTLFLPLKSKAGFHTLIAFPRAET
jgi:hypothetical protein